MSEFSCEPMSDLEYIIAHLRVATYGFSDAQDPKCSNIEVCLDSAFSALQVAILFMDSLTPDQLKDAELRVHMLAVLKASRSKAIVDNIEPLVDSIEPLY